MRAIATFSSAEIQWQYERGWKDLSNRHYPAESWPSLAEIQTIVPHSAQNRTFLTLYRCA